MSEENIPRAETPRKSTLWSDFKKAVAMCVLLWLLLLTGAYVHKSRNKLEVGREDWEKFRADLRKAGYLVDGPTAGGEGSNLSAADLEAMAKDIRFVTENGEIIEGYENVAAYIKTHIDPDKFKADFERIFKDYYHPMDAPDFDARSLEKSRELRQMAMQNLEVMEMVANLLQSKAGQRVTQILADNAIKAVNSPSAPLIERGFELWKSGRKSEALALFNEADRKDPETHYVQIVSHHAKAFLKAEMRDSLGNIMEDYFELGKESKKYFNNFKPVIEDLGFNPKQLYDGRDPFTDHKDFPDTKRMKEVLDDPWKEIMTAAQPELDRLNEQAQKHITVLEKFLGKNGDLIKGGNPNMKPEDVPNLMATIKDLEELNRPLFEALEKNNQSPPPPEGSGHRERDVEIHSRKQQDEFNAEYNLEF